jgi:allophanate hydrolase
VLLAVAGAHMRGLPLNRQLTSRGARYVRDAVTAPVYRLYAMDGDPPRPGLVQVTGGGGAVEVELWRLAPAALGSLLTEVPAPLAIGRVTLAGGEQVCGFVCEGHAGERATDITALGGWRAYVTAGAV